MSGLRDRLVEGGYAAGWRLVRALPEPAARALFNAGADRAARGDGAVFGAVVYYFAMREDPWGGLPAGLLCLVLGQVVSYVKARAESVGLDADVGIAERSERLIIVGIGGLISGIGGDGFEWGLPAALWVLALLSFVTVVQRLLRAAASDRANLARSTPPTPPAATPPAATSPDTA